MLYTSYFANVNRLPKKMVLISISRKPPVNWAARGWSLKSLAPSQSLLDDWHRGLSEEAYTQRFTLEVTGVKSASELVANLQRKFGDADICFLCYEKKGFCHRHLVAKWLNENGYTCREWQA